MHFLNFEVRVKCRKKFTFAISSPDEFFVQFASAFLTPSSMFISLPLVDVCKQLQVVQARWM